MKRLNVDLAKARTQVAEAEARASVAASNAAAKAADSAELKRERDSAATELVAAQAEVDRLGAELALSTARETAVNEELAAIVASAAGKRQVLFLLVVRSVVCECLCLVRV